MGSVARRQQVGFAGVELHVEGGEQRSSAGVHPGQRHQIADTRSAAHLIGEENRGFYHLMQNLPKERLGIATYAVPMARRAFDFTVDYVSERNAFGTPIGKFQVNRHFLAEMKNKLDAAPCFVDHCVMAANDGKLTAEDAAGLKWWTSEVQWEIMDRCLQLHGGYGYINEYEIARLSRDSRVQRLYGATTEIMEDLVGRSMGF
jgi:acyl-CoA dehydrogenase